MLEIFEVFATLRRPGRPAGAARISLRGEDLARLRGAPASARHREAILRLRKTGAMVNGLRAVRLRQGRPASRPEEARGLGESLRPRRVAR